MENMETSVSITLYQLYLTAGSRPVGWGGGGGGGGVGAFGRTPPPPLVQTNFACQQNNLFYIHT